MAFHDDRLNGTYFLICDWNIPLWLGTSLCRYVVYLFFFLSHLRLPAFFFLPRCPQTSPFSPLSFISFHGPYTPLASFNPSAPWNFVIFAVGPPVDTRCLVKPTFHAFLYSLPPPPTQARAFFPPLLLPRFNREVSVIFFPGPRTPSFLIFKLESRPAFPSFLWFSVEIVSFCSARPLYFFMSCAACSPAASFRFG